MLNSCILITSHLNSPDKEQIALGLIDFLKDKNLPIIFVGNYKIPESIQEKVDWVFYTKENPSINRHMHVWHQLPFDPKFKTNIAYKDYGYAHLLQTYRGFKLADNLGYDHVIHINYDMGFPDNAFQTVLDEIKTNPNLVMWWGEENSQNGYATNFYCFNIKDFISMSDRYLHFYKNNNPPGIRKGWYCEPFFEWMVNKSSVNHKKIKLNIENKAQFLHFRISGKLCKFYGWEEKNILLLWFEHDTPPNLNELTFHHKNNFVQASPTPHPRYFTLPLSKGEYFTLEKEFTFKVDDPHLDVWKVIPMH